MNTDLTSLRQTIAELTFAYADREAAWLNRYNKNDQGLEWSFKEGFYQRRFQELLKLISAADLQRLHAIITNKLEKPPGESTRQRSPEEVLELIRRFRQSIDSSTAEQTDTAG